MNKRKYSKGFSVIEFFFGCVILIIVATGLDFFTLSECRDALFHVQEHTFDLPQIAAFLKENGLEFLGFDTAPDLTHRYARRFPQDAARTNLENWAVLEQENPDIFIGMYQFWVQKP